MTRVAAIAAFTMLTTASPALAQYQGPGYSAPSERAHAPFFFTGVEIEAGTEFSGSSFIEGEQILGALTVEARDFGDTHGAVKRIALRGVREAGEVVEISIAVALTEADSDGAVEIGAVGLDPITATFGDYSKLSIEVGGRRYFGDRYATMTDSNWRSFIGGSIGLAKLDAIDAVLQSDGFDGLGLGLTDTVAVGVFDDSWVPTLSASAGLQYRVTRQLALEAEIGARWDAAADENDDELSVLGLEPINDTQGRLSYPAIVRGRYVFQ